MNHKLFMVFRQNASAVHVTGKQKHQACVVTLGRDYSEYRTVYRLLGE